MDSSTVLEEEISAYVSGSRAHSSAQLAWFLDVVWRMATEDMDDAICDGGGDKGIDAIVVDDDLGEITVFQSKYRQSHDAIQGDRDLKNLIGAIAYFESPETVRRLLSSRPNLELSRLLKRLEIESKVADGAYVTKAVFVTNGTLDSAGRDYAMAMSARAPGLEVWDRPRLESVAAWTRRADLRPEQIRLKTASSPSVLPLNGTTTIALALVDAVNLVSLPGIDDLTLFARNVRLELGRTRISRELGETLRETSEHPLFPAYHNGLTILTHKVSVDGSELILEGASVVNGCQSLMALHKNRELLSSEVKVLVKAVAVDPASDLSDKITYRTNNQNPVSLRDQRSTDPIQRQLQSEMRQWYGDKLAYSIRAGESFSVPTLDNSVAAQLITAVYLDEPWNAVRKVRLFDEDYRRIFNRTITAHHLYLLYYIHQIVESFRTEMRPELSASFASVRFTVISMLARVLRLTDQGKDFLASPQRWFPQRAPDVNSVLTELVSDVVQSINFYIEAREREADEGDTAGSFDPKVEFKSRAGVTKLEQDVLRDARRHAMRAQRDGDPYLFVLDPGN